MSLLDLAMPGAAFCRKPLNVFPGDGSCNEQERKGSIPDIFHPSPSFSPCHFRRAPGSDASWKGDGGKFLFWEPTTECWVVSDFSPVGFPPIPNTSRPTSPRLSPVSSHSIPSLAAGASRGFASKGPRAPHGTMPCDRTGPSYLLILTPTPESNLPVGQTPCGPGRLQLGRGAQAILRDRQGHHVPPRGRVAVPGGGRAGVVGARENHMRREVARFVGGVCPP
jgi:hypothetical protein